MAITTPRKVPSAYAEGGSDSTSTTVTYGVTPTENNLMLMFFWTRSNSVTTPSGWTEADQVGTGDDFSCFYKIAGASEGSSVSVTTAATDQSAWMYFEYEGIDTTTPIRATNVEDTTGSTTSRGTGTATGALAGDVPIVAFASRENISAQSFTNGFVLDENYLWLSGNAAELTTGILPNLTLDVDKSISSTMSWTTSSSTRGMVIVLRAATAPDFEDAFTGTNGNAWNSTNWPTVTIDPNNTGNTSTIQSNAGNVTTNAVTGSYVSQVSSTSTTAEDAEVRLRVNPNASGNSNGWLYVCFRSSGEVQDSADGRPAYAYYFRIHVGSSQVGNTDYLYRRDNDTESSTLVTLGAGSHYGRTGGEDFYVHFRCETDGSNVKLSYACWDATDPPRDQFSVYTDTAPGGLASYSGELQLVWRNYNSSHGIDASVDELQYWNLAGTSDQTITPGLLTVTQTLYSPQVAFSYSYGIFKVWNGSAWVAATTNNYNGATWGDGLLYGYDGTGWT